MPIKKAVSVPIQLPIDRVLFRTDYIVFSLFCRIVYSNKNLLIR